MKKEKKRGAMIGKYTKRNMTDYKVRSGFK